jgi:hypothetical protein
MKRLRISPFQIAILRLIQENTSPFCMRGKRSLYGRERGFSVSERVTLGRSVRRLCANGMIEEVEEQWFGAGYRLTEKGLTWLDTRPSSSNPAQ